MPWKKNSSQVEGREGFLLNSDHSILMNHYYFIGSRLRHWKLGDDPRLCAWAEVEYSQYIHETYHVENTKDSAPGPAEGFVVSKEINAYFEAVTYT